MTLKNPLLVLQSNIYTSFKEEIIPIKMKIFIKAALVVLLILNVAIATAQQDVPLDPGLYPTTDVSKPTP
ncbi:13845_t:CDS:2 [Funneliformis mosseae]|uniref:13845_t:CDS:1 n=1 Tax=Funneliformis mosseae TaxID=27381 RepID=A0A9N9FUM5_FUNMO|nr:13845_t:CDS:2 [Funneliformis mosseae]